MKISKTLKSIFKRHVYILDTVCESFFRTSEQDVFQTEVKVSLVPNVKDPQAAKHHRGNKRRSIPMSAYGRIRKQGLDVVTKDVHNVVVAISVANLKFIFKIDLKIFQTFKMYSIY